MKNIPPTVISTKNNIDQHESSSDSRSTLQSVTASAQPVLVRLDRPSLREPSSNFSLNHAFVQKADSKALEDAFHTLGLSQELHLVTDAILKKAKHKQRKTVDFSVLENAEKLILEAKNSLCKDKMAQASPITNQLFLGPHTVARNRDELSKLGITAIISMTAECGIQFPDDNTLEYCFLADKLVEHTCTIEDILDIIDDVYHFAAEKLKYPSEKILIHCVQGKTRSAAAAAYIVAKSSGTSIDQAYQFIKSKRDVFIPEAWLSALQIKINDSSKHG